MGAIIFSGKVGLAVGLDWRPLTKASRQAADQMIRELARDNDAERIARVKRANGDEAVGLFARDDLDESAANGGPGKAFAAAAVLATMAGEAQNVIAAITFQMAGRERVAVLVVEGGLPVSDTVQSLDAAIESIQNVRAGKHGFANHRLFSNSLDAFAAPGDPELLTLDDLAGNARTQGRLVRAPANLRVMAVALLALTVLVAGGLAGKVGYDGHQAKKRAAEARARDPVPKYEAALAEQIGRLGLNRSSVQRLLADLQGYPAWIQGWELKQIDCSAAGCKSVWDRKGGTTAALVQARPSDKLVLEESSADRAVLVWDAGLEPAGLGRQADAVLLSEANTLNASLFQTWANAGIRLQRSGAYSVWPEIGVEVPAEVVLRTQPVEAFMPFALAPEAVVQSPRDVFWQQLSVAVDMAGKAQTLNVTLKGVSYVR